jgi:thioredoxin 1
MVLSVSGRTFTKEVLESTTPVLVDFWAPWCGLCRAIEPLLLQFQSASTEPIKLVRINADENLKLANDYRLKTLPTLLFFDRGQLIYRIDSCNGREEIRAGLRDLLEQVMVPYSA